MIRLCRVAALWFVLSAMSVPSQEISDRVVEFARRLGSEGERQQAIEDLHTFLGELRPVEGQALDLNSTADFVVGSRLLVEACPTFADDSPNGNPLSLLDEAQGYALTQGLADFAAMIELSRARYRIQLGELTEAERGLLEASEGLEGALVNGGFLRSTLIALIRKREAWSLALEQTELALDWFETRQEAIEEAQDSSAPWHRVMAALHGERGQAYRGLGVANLASLSFVEERTHAEASGDPSSLLVSLLHRIDLCLMLERFDEVLVLLQENPVPANSREAGSLLLAAGLAYSELARESTDRKVAADRTSAAHRLLKKIVDSKRAMPLTRVQALVNLADLGIRTGDLEGASQWLEMTAASMPVVPESSHLRDQWAQYQAQRARLILARGGTKRELSAVLEDLEQALEHMFESWSRAPSLAGGVGFLRPAHRRQFLSTLIRVAIAADPDGQGVARAFGYLMEAQAMSDLTRRLAPGSVEVATVRREFLNPGQGVLAYLTAKERSHVFLLDGTRLMSVELESTDALSSVAQSARNALAKLRTPTLRKDEKARSELEEALVDLRDSFLPPSIREALKSWQHVTLVGMERVGHPPLELVPLPGRGRLAWALAVDRLPSLPLGVGLARREKAADRAGSEQAPVRPDVMLLAHLDVADEMRAEYSQLESISFQEPDAKKQLEAYDPERVSILMNEEVLPQALTRVDFTGTRITQWMVHGVLDHREERWAKLILGPTVGDTLDCDAVESMEFRGLVILGTCSAGSGPVRVGNDGQSHLGGAFLSAGASAVLLSRHPVTFAQTSRLLRELHGALQSPGVSVAEALRVARVRCVEGGDPALDFADAQFEVFGLGGLSLELQ